MSRQNIHRLTFSLLLSAFCLTFWGSPCFAGPSADKLLERKGFAWRSADTEHFRLHFEANTFAETRIEELKRWQENAFARNLQLLDVRDYPYKIDTFIVSSRERMKELIGRETNGIALPDTKVICFILNEKTNAAGAHELMHVMARNIWTGKSKTWINEGLAVYSDDRWWGHNLHNLNKYLLESNRLIPLVTLIENFTGSSAMVAYPQAGSFVKYLYEQYGVGRVKQLWANGSVKDFQRVLGKDLATVEKEWHDKLTSADSTRIKYDFSLSGSLMSDEL